MKGKSVGIMARAMTVVLLAPAGLASAATTISYISWTGTENYEAEKKVIQEFMRRNPDIKVKYSNPGWSGYLDKIITMIAAGTAPDCIRVDNSWMRSFYTSGALMNLNAYIKGSRVDMKAYYQSQVENFNYNGAQLAMPLSMNAEPILYNRKMVREAGLADLAESYSPKTWTRTAWMETAKKLTKDNNGDGKIDVWGCGDVPEWIVERLVFRAGGDFFSADGKRCTLNTPEGLDGLNTIWQMRQELKCWDPKSKGGSFVWDKTGAMMFMAGWGIKSAISKRLEFDYVPAYNDKRDHVFSHSGDGVGVSANSRNKKAAWELVRFMAGEWAATFGAREGTITPAHIRGATEGYAQSDPIPKHKSFILDEAAKSVARYPKVLKNIRSVNAVLYPYLDDMYLGKRTPKETASLIETAVNRLLR